MESSYQSAAVIIPLSPEQLESLIRQSVLSILSEHPPNPAGPPPSQGDDYLTRDEACRLLHVSLMTLRKYEKQRKLVPCRFGRRVLYRKRDVEAALAQSLR